MAQDAFCCFVCKLADRRALVDVTLADGSTAVLCGSHAVMFRRAPALRSQAELASLGERRKSRPERRNPEVDELAVALRLGFSGDRRASVDRRG